MNQSSIIVILKSISDALSSGRNDIKSVLISLSALIIFFILMPFIIKAKNRSDIKKASITAFTKLSRKYNLTALEFDLIDELSAVLNNPDKKYLLLINKGTFRNVVHRSNSLGTEKKELIASLSAKLGFSVPTKPPSSLPSTRAFKPGMPVQLETDFTDTIHAEIISVSDNGFSLKYEKTDVTLNKGSAFKLIICAFDGFRVFSLFLNQSKENLLYFGHSEADKIIKTKIRFKVFLELERAMPDDIRKTFVIMLAEKGAVIFNPGRRLYPGDDIRIYLDADRKKNRHVNAEVIKAPISGKAASVRYTHVNR